MERYVILGAALVLAAITWIFLGGSVSSTQQPASLEQKSKAKRFKFQTNLPASADLADPRDVGIRDAAALTRKRVAEQGLLGQEVRWISPIMDQPSWSLVSGRDVPTYKNTNGVELSYSAPSGRVTRVNAVFPPTAMSADLTALTEYLIGNQTHLPMHFEVYRRPDGTPKFGDFLGPDGRRYYYRGVYRQSGDSPYGPKEFAVSVHPFVGQPYQLEEHQDEHKSPRRPIPLDAGRQ